MKKISFLIASIMILTLAFNNRAQAQKKWSRQAKNGAIGAGAGAIIGAVADKNNRGVGALIGGVVGGGAGYLYGKHRNKEAAEDRASTVYYRGYRTHTAAKRNTVSNGESFVSSDVNSAYGPDGTSSMCIQELLY